MKVKNDKYLKILLVVILYVVLLTFATLFFKKLFQRHEWKRSISPTQKREIVLYQRKSIWQGYVFGWTSAFMEIRENGRGVGPFWIGEMDYEGDWEHRYGETDWMGDTLFILGPNGALFDTHLSNRQFRVEIVAEDFEPSTALVLDLNWNYIVYWPEVKGERIYLADSPNYYTGLTCWLISKGRIVSKVEVFEEDKKSIREVSIRIKDKEIEVSIDGQIKDTGLISKFIQFWRDWVRVIRMIRAT